MNRKTILILNYITSILLLLSCSGIESSKEDNTETYLQEKKNHSIYLYSDPSIESFITISGNSWHGKLIIKSGFGSSYDNSNASYSSGIVKGSILYDEHALIKLGNIDNQSLEIPIGSKRVTHQKQ